MRKPAFCTCEIKVKICCATPQADSRLCLHVSFLDLKFMYLTPGHFQSLAIFFDCTSRFVSDLVGD